MCQTYKPDKSGYFGEFGGKYVPETLVAPLEELEREYLKYKEDDDFDRELRQLLKEYVGRPTPLFYAQGLSSYLGGVRVYLKREDLAHTGAHKINNTLGQGLLAKKMGKKKLVAETGAGQHGVAAATVAALLGLDCEVFMGALDIERQTLNVFRMELLGARVHSVKSGSETLKDATNEAIRYWVSNVSDCYYLIGSVVGPHPYPMIVRDFQKIIGEETIEQIKEKEGDYPDYLVACLGGGSNAMGIMYPFIDIEGVNLIGVEAGGEGKERGEHAAVLNYGTKGVLHGSMSYLLQSEEGQIDPVHSISAGLDYPGVGPEHSYLKEKKGARYEMVDDREALEAFKLLAKTEGIIPALESSHALAYAKRLAEELKVRKGKESKKGSISNSESNENKTPLIVVNLSGRGDKDVKQVSEMEGIDVE